VGYKMFKYALKFCEFDIPHFVPAAIIGVWYNSWMQCTLLIMWTDCAGKHDKINFSAWFKTFPDLCVMIVVVLLDCLLKLKVTEAKLPRPRSTKTTSWNWMD
jgi:hypothetical protein